MEAPSNSLISNAAYLLGGGLLTKLADLLMGRKGREVKALNDAIGSLSSQLQAADDRMDAFGDRLDECHELHEACEAGRRQDRAEHDRLRAELNAKIDSLMQGSPATYQLNAMKGDPGRGEGQ